MNVQLQVSKSSKGLDLRDPKSLWKEYLRPSFSHPPRIRAFREIMTTCEEEEEKEAVCNQRSYSDGIVDGQR